MQTPIYNTPHAQYVLVLSETVVRSACTLLMPKRDGGILYPAFLPTPFLRVLIGKHIFFLFCLLFQVKELICSEEWLWVQVHVLENKQNTEVLEELLCFVISVRVAKRASKQPFCLSVCLSVSV